MLTLQLYLFFWRTKDNVKEDIKKKQFFFSNFSFFFSIKIKKSGFFIESFLSIKIEN